MGKLLPEIEAYSQKRIAEFTIISNDRKTELGKVSEFIENRIKNHQSVDLMFICIHNSRRSHMSQIWAQSAAYFYGIKNVHTYSGGVEATTFNPRVVRALKKAGFKIKKIDKSKNPEYNITYANNAVKIRSFSKKYSDRNNPQSDFCAVMTCAQADEACPIVYGATERVSINYDDPKIFDGTNQEEEKYDERCRQISREMLYIFSKINI